MMDFKEYSENCISLYDNEIPEILSQFCRKTVANSAVLDLGCGDGDLLVALQNNDCLKRMTRIVGVDLSTQRIERLKKRGIPNLELICSDACEVRQLEDNGFDYLFNMQVIEHVPSDKKLLAEIYRLLKKDGILYISSVVKKKYGWYVHRCNNKWVLDPTHLREYSSKEEFISLIRHSGFEIAQTKMTLYKFSPMDFFIKRIYSPIFRPDAINSFFLRHKILNKLRMLKVPIMGYYIIEVVAKKKEP